MPEGVEVRWTTNCLKGILEGLELTNIIEHSNKSIKNNELFKPTYKCIKIGCKGKLLYLELQNGKSKLYLTVQFGLNGYFSTKPNHNYLRYSFVFTGVTLYYYDKINYGHLELLTVNSFTEKINKLGIDIFNPSDFNQSNLNTLINFNKESNICVFLMNQHILAGIGNYAKSEILYHSNISPKRVMKSLTIKEKKDLYESICYVIYSCYLAGFSVTRTGEYYNIFTNLNCNLDDITQTDLLMLKLPKVPNKYIIQVYGKSEDLFGNRVDKLETSDGRTTYWVPLLQK
jgi:formamidopyrimidine-DNA glycosylase